jgi:hypothetical protein
MIVLDALRRALSTVLDLVTEVKWKVSWRLPRPELGCRAKGIKNDCLYDVFQFAINSEIPKSAS